MDNPISWNHKNPGKRNREARRAAEAQNATSSRHRAIVAITTAGLAALSEDREAQPRASDIQRILRYVDEGPGPAKKPRTEESIISPGELPVQEPEGDYYIDGSARIQEVVEVPAFQSFLNEEPHEEYFDPNTRDPSCQDPQENCYPPANTPIGQRSEFSAPVTYATIPELDLTAAAQAAANAREQELRQITILRARETQRRRANERHATRRSITPPRASGRSLFERIDTSSGRRSLFDRIGTSPSSEGGRRSLADRITRTSTRRHQRRR